jgi:Phage integrase family
VLKRVAHRAGLNCGNCVSKTKKLSKKEVAARLAAHKEATKGRAPIVADAAFAELDALTKAPKTLTCKTDPVCEHYKLHRFRKTFATKLHRDGIVLADLRKYLGHKHLSTTQKYLEQSDLKAAHIRAVVDKAFSFLMGFQSELGSLVMSLLVSTSNSALGTINSVLPQSRHTTSSGNTNTGLLAVFLSPGKWMSISARYFS